MWKLNNCRKCQFIDRSSSTCKAYPSKIPNAIWQDREEHNEVFSNQQSNHLYSFKADLFENVDKVEKNIRESDTDIESIINSLITKIKKSIKIDSFHSNLNSSYPDMIELIFDIKNWGDKIRVYISCKGFSEKEKNSNSFFLKGNLFELNIILTRLEKWLTLLHFYSNLHTWKGNKLVIYLKSNNEIDILFEESFKEVKFPKINNGEVVRIYSDLENYDDRLSKLQKMYSDWKNKKSHEITRNEAIEKIRILIKEEDERMPLKDEEIKQSFEKEGKFIFKRTIASVRHELGIPPARLRKK